MTSTGTYNSFDYVEWKKDWIVQQFTGLLDKNGKEIYEGDVISHGVDKFTVKWYEKHHCFALFSGSIPHRSINSGRSYLIDKQCEIVGNIYENSNLLEK